MNKDMERRAYSFEMRADHKEDNDGVGVVTGRPIVYESRTNIGEFDEIISKGALDKANLKDVRFLVNHDVNKIPLARSRNNNENSTMRLMPDDKGLAIRVNLDIENNTDARNLYSAIERGDITGMSFMFAVADGGDDWDGLDTDHPTRTITAISDVLEVSAVTFPAYEDTEISTRALASLESARTAVDTAKRSLESALKLQKEKNKILGGIL